jgi:hypothetical protein
VLRQDVSPGSNQLTIAVNTLNAQPSTTKTEQPPFRLGKLVRRCSPESDTHSASVGTNHIAKRRYRRPRVDKLNADATLLLRAAAKSHVKASETHIRRVPALLIFRQVSLQSEQQF